MPHSILGLPLHVCLILAAWWMLLAFFAWSMCRMSAQADDDIAAIHASLDNVEAMLALNKGWREGS